MVVQGIKERSKIRETRKDPEMGVHGRKGRSGEDPGKIHRSMGVWCSGVSEEKRMRGGGQGRRDKGEDK